MAQRRSHWYYDALRSLERAITEARAQGFEGREFSNYISGSYPFQLRQGFACKCWLDARRAMLGRNRAEPGTNRIVPTGDPDDLRDYFAKLDGPDSDAWDAMLVRKRGELAAAGIEADEWTDEAVADWRPAAKEIASDG